jgi:DnaK suppressor protein
MGIDMALKKENRPDSRKKILKQMLEIRRKEVVRQLEALMSGEGVVYDTDPVQDEGDRSVKDHESDLDLALVEMKSRIVKEIDEALIKLEEGRYGICESCGAEISPARLKAMPFARYCIACQNGQDFFEKIEKRRSG